VVRVLLRVRWIVKKVIEPEIRVVLAIRITGATGDGGICLFSLGTRSGTSLLSCRVPLKSRMTPIGILG